MSHGITEINTARLRLEPACEEHAALVFDQVSDERLWEHFPELRPKTLGELEALYRRWESARANPAESERIENWTAFERATNVPVASNQTTVFPDGTASFAIVVYTSHHGKGYALEFAEAIFAHLHTALGVQLIRFEIDTRNKAAIKLAESLGFTLAEERRGVDRQYGLYGDESVYVRKLS